VRQIYPVHGPDLQVVPKAAPGPLPVAVEALARLYSSDADASWLRANMVASVDGAASLDGRSGGLSGPGDRMIFVVLRSLADLVLVGAGTATTERYRPAQAAELWQQLRPADAPQPAIAVVTARLNLDPDGQLLTEAAAGAKTIVVTTADAPRDRKAAIARHARVVEAGHDHVDMTAAVTALRSLGYARILCEGGPTLLGQLAAAGLINELCLTTSPLLANGRAGRILVPNPSGTPAAPPTDLTTQLSLAHLLADENFLFSRYLTGSAGT
jgi:riboflavin biosynthesis pyrimidine reductase